MPLQKFMKQQSTALLTSDRASRLEAAKTLPTPLYTVFYQLQQYIDLQTNVADEERMSVSVLNDASKQVLLQLPVPDVVAKTKSSHKRVTIHFQCAQHTGVPFVTAIASGCGTSLNQDVLLDELFPHDVPISSTNDTTTIVGRPYHWCNTLAGLPHVPPDPQTCTANTRVIVRELKKRIRANATLKHILHGLQRNHVPAVPHQEKDIATASSNSTLASFVQKGDDDNKR